MKRFSHKPTAAEIDAIASDWVLRCEEGLDASAQLDFERWRSADPQHAAAFERAQQTWSLLDRPLHAGRGREMERTLSARRKRRRSRRAGVACAALLVALGLFAFQSLRQPEALSPHPTARGVVVSTSEKHALPDGGSVELKAGAEIAVDYSGALRRVYLRKGEALFHVAENKTRAFVVTAGGVEVRAVGTAFLVQLGGEQQVDVVVTHGRVAVEKPATATQQPTGGTTPPVLAFSRFLDAGQRITVESAPGASAPDVVRLSEAELADRLAWRGPRVEFNDTPLAEAVMVMNRHSPLQLVVDDAQLATLPVNGLFRADNTETLVRLLEASFGVKAERSGNVITLRKAR